MSDKIMIRIQQPSSLLDGLPTPPPFVADALCAQTDPDVFFPEQGGPVFAAKKLCHQCSVINQCLAYALETGEQHGIWGGLTTNERNKLNKGKVA